MITKDILLASGLFSSLTQLRNAVKQHAVRINRVLVDSIDDNIEEVDFLNAWVIPHGIELIKERILIVSFGRNHAMVQCLEQPLPIDIISFCSNMIKGQNSE